MEAINAIEEDMRADDLRYLEEESLSFQGLSLEEEIFIKKRLSRD